MPAKRHTPEAIVRTLQELARRLGKDTLTSKDVREHLGGHLPLSSIRPYFGSLGNALEAAGLQRNTPDAHLKERGNTISDDELFRSILAVERTLGRMPNRTEYEFNAKYSIRPLRKRFGKWPEVIAHYKKWKTDKGSELLHETDTNADAFVAQAITAPEPVRETQGNASLFFAPIGVKRAPQLYGEPIDFRGLRHAPINEQGVVYLFGMVSRELGFSIEALQQGFPDCEGKYLYDRKKNLWAKARIEFEFRASNFREHGHDAAQCDFVVCWENDWPDCPINVIELRKELLKLSSR